jgi:PAS domain S-box-containing protein
MIKFKRSLERDSRSGKDSTKDGSNLLGTVRRTALSVLAVFVILVAIAGNTVLAVRQTVEQNSAVQALQSSSRLKQDLDQLQQKMLDEHGELYTLISTKSFYRRSPYVFPLQALSELTNDARHACGRKTSCLSQLDDLDGMVRLLGGRSDALFKRATEHPGSVGLGDTQLSEIDAYFYSVLEHVVEVRMQADAAVDTTISKSSRDAKSVSTASLFCGLTAAAILLALIYRNSRIAQRLRVALRQADRAREKYQRFFDEHPLPICVFDDASLSIVAANRTAQRTFGYSEAELLRMSLRDVRPEEEHLQFEEAMALRRDGDDETTRSLGTWLHRSKTSRSGWTRKPNSSNRSRHSSTFSTTFLRGSRGRTRTIAMWAATKSTRETPDSRRGAR